eukprot:jgi/Psemu1/29136/gm1.29136_g
MITTTSRNDKDNKDKDKDKDKDKSAPLLQQQQRQFISSSSNNNNNNNNNGDLSPPPPPPTTTTTTTTTTTIPICLLLLQQQQRRFFSSSSSSSNNNNNNNNNSDFSPPSSSKSESAPLILIHVSSNNSDSSPPPTTTKTTTTTIRRSFVVSTLFYKNRSLSPHDVEMPEAHQEVIDCQNTMTVVSVPSKQNIKALDSYKEESKVPEHQKQMSPCCTGRITGGVRCSDCKQFYCQTCLLSLHHYYHMLEKIKVIIPHPIQRMMDAAANAHLTTIPVPVCHGCVFRQQQKKGMQCHRDHVPCWCQKAQFKYDGYLVLPGFNFMMDTPLSSSRVINIHGFGDKPGLHSVLHFVIDPKLAHNVATLGAKARCLAASDAAAQVLHCKSVYLGSLDVTGKRHKCLVDLIILQGHKFKHQSKAMKPQISDFSTFMADQINNTLMFTFANRKPKHEATIIVGTFNNNAMGSKHNLLLVRFYHAPCAFQMTPAVINEFYDALSNHTMKNNIERMRFGGSSGIFDGLLSPAFFKMLDDPNVLPRWRTATMIIPERSHIQLVYINRDRIPQSFRYSMPQFGGQLSIDQELFFNKKFSFFTPFMESKIAAALLLQYLSRLHHLNIVPLVAVKHELGNWRLAQETAQAYGSGDHKGEILFQFASLNCCTLVQHPGGLVHYDSFG